MVQDARAPTAGTPRLCVRGKRVLVTGGSGFIGRNVVARLVAEGAAVRVLARDPDRARTLLPAAAEVVRGDVTNPTSVREALRGCAVAFHFAAVLGDEFKPLSQYRAVNVGGTRNVLQAAQEIGVERLLHASTAWAYGARVAGTVTEALPLARSGLPYCDTKYEGEILVREFATRHRLPAVIVQPTDVYGPGDETYVLGALRLMESGRMILPADGRGLMNALYIDDLVDGIMLAAAYGRTGDAYLLASPWTVDCRKFYVTLARNAGLAEAFPSVPAWAAILLATITEKMGLLFTREAVYSALIRARYDGSKARRELGFAPVVELAEGMRRVGAWYRSRHAGVSCGREPANPRGEGVRS